MQENIKLVGNLIRREVMNLNELKKLAEAVYGQNKDDWELKQALYKFDKAASPQQVLKMIDGMEMMADVVRANLEDGKLTNEQYEWHRQAISAYNKLNSEE